MAGQESPQPLPSLGEQEAGRREQRGPSQRHAGRQIARAEPRPAGPSAAPPLFRGEGRQEGRHRGPPRPSLGAGGGKGRRQRAGPRNERQREQSPAAPQESREPRREAAEPRSHTKGPRGRREAAGGQEQGQRGQEQAAPQREARRAPQSQRRRARRGAGRQPQEAARPAFVVPFSVWPASI